MKALYIIIIIGILLVGGFFIFFGGENEETSTDKTAPTNNEVSDNSNTKVENKEEEKSSSNNALWRTAELVDIRTGEKFTIDQFDKPILLESFAVWCPTCTKQQWEIKDLHKEVGDNAISISLNTDPNEDREKVLEHITINNFDWYYAISPPEVTQSLIDEFGFTVANAPSAPVILIDNNNNAKLLRNGVKSSSELKSELKL